jgi:two-component system copper resistance phosphate regulon response regulator CusR
MKVLLVEDDPRVSGFVERGLDQLGFQVEVAVDGRRGLNRALGGGHEVVVLDLLLPELDGNHVLAELRRRGAGVPVLVLSALDGVGDRVRALNDGADDYLVKPFSFDELVARVRALGRRPQGITADVLEVADLCMDLATRRVTRAGRSVSLTAKEFALLEYLVRHEDAVVTRTMIAEHVWGQHFGSFSNVIDVYIRYLRAKVDQGCELKLIHTVRGVGYVLSERHP